MPTTLRALRSSTTTIRVRLSLGTSTRSTEARKLAHPLPPRSRGRRSPRCIAASVFPIALPALHLSIARHAGNGPLVGPYWCWLRSHRVSSIARDRTGLAAASSDGALWQHPLDHDGDHLSVAAWLPCAIVNADKTLKLWNLPLTPKDRSPAQAATAHDASAILQDAPPVAIKIANPRPWRRPRE